MTSSDRRRFIGSFASAGLGGALGPSALKAGLQSDEDIDVEQATDFHLRRPSLPV